MKHKKKKLIKEIRQFNWRIRDEIMHRRNGKGRGGYFDSWDWISCLSEGLLNELESHISHIRFLIDEHTDT